jgi:hypothetical protein
VRRSLRKTTTHVACAGPVRLRYPAKLSNRVQTLAGDARAIETTDDDDDLGVVT